MGEKRACPPFRGGCDLNAAPLKLTAMTDVKIALGRVIKQLRQRRGLTQDELAGKATLHRTYVSDVERGVRNLSIISLHQISAALETPLSEIFKHVETAGPCINENAGQA